MKFNNKANQKKVIKKISNRKNQKDVNKQKQSSTMTSKEFNEN